MDQIAYHPFKTGRYLFRQLNPHQLLVYFHHPVIPELFASETIFLPFLINNHYTCHLSKCPGDGISIFRLYYYPFPQPYWGTNESKPDNARTCSPHFTPSFPILILFKGQTLMQVMHFVQPFVVLNFVGVLYIYFAITPVIIPCR